MEKRGEAQVASVKLDDHDDEILPFWGSKRKNAGKTAPDGRREKREREREWMSSGWSNYPTVSRSGAARAAW